MFAVTEIAGFIASGLVLLTFAMRDMRLLRTVRHLQQRRLHHLRRPYWLLPVLALHLLLLPLNIFRLTEVSAGGSNRPHV